MCFVFSASGSELETELEELIDSQTNPTIAPLAGDGEVTLRLTAKHESKDVAVTLLNELESEIRETVGEYLYGYNQDSLVGVGFRLLKEKGLTLAAGKPDGRTCSKPA